jgi:hypothetical protein
MIPTFDAYKTGTYPFPNDDIDPQKKDAKWHLAWGKAIMYAHYQGNCLIKPNEYENIRINRLYAIGKQPSETYKNYYLGEKNDNGSRESWMNVNFDNILSPAPQILSKILGQMEGIEHDIVCESVNERAGAEREKMKWDLWFQKKYEEELKFVNQVIGLKQEENPVLPESMEELKLYAEMGGFKLEYEVAMEQALQHTFEISDHPQIKRKIITDLITIGKSATMDVVDEVTQKVYEEYIDVADTIIEYCPTSDYSDSRYAAYLKWTTILEIRKNTKLSEVEVQKIAYNNSGKYGNASWTQNNIIENNGIWAYDSYKIPVLVYSVKSINQKYQTDIKRGGKTVSYPERFGKIWDTDIKKTKIIDVEVIYSAKWIIGTEYVYDWGLMNDIPRPTMKTVSLPFHVYQMNTPSLMEQMKPILDQIALIDLKYQNDMAQAIPPGILFEMGAFDNIALTGDKKATPLQLMKLIKQTGSGFFREKEVTNPNVTHGKPFEIHNGAANSIIQSTSIALDMAFKQLSYITGIDSISLSGNTPNDTSATEIKSAVASTSNVLKPLYSAYVWIKEDFSRNAASRIQQICMFNKDETIGYYPVIGASGVEALKVAGKDKCIKWGIHIYARPTDIDRNEILQAALESMKVGKNGQPGISMSEYLFLSQQVKKAGGIKYARAYLAYREGKNKEESQMISMQNMKANKEMELAVKQQTDASSKDLETHKVNEAIREYYAKAVIDQKVADEDLMRTIKQKVAENQVNNAMQPQEQSQEQ